MFDISLSHMRSAVCFCLLAAVCLPLRADVIFSEDYEDDNLADRGWYDMAGFPEDQSITTDEHATGSACLEYRYPAGSTGPFWMHHLFTGHDLVYVRFYRKFEANWEWTGHAYGPHDVLVFAGEYQVPTDTDLTIYIEENEGTPVMVIKDKLQGGHFGEWGTTYRQNVGTPVLMENDRWYCLEAMARMNTPYQSDGEIRMWVDGEPVILVEDLKLRDDDHTDIRFDHFMLGPYFHDGPSHAQKAWFDALVVATEYVGPAGGDTTPPTGSVLINGGAELTNTADVTLTLQAQDPGSGMSGGQMRFRNESGGWSPVFDYATAHAWTLSAGDGEKIVGALFCDAAGNWMTVPVTDTITLDTVPPDPPEDVDATEVP